MHSQENYKTQVGQRPYMSPPAFQQRPGPAPAPAPAPAPVTPLTFLHGPLETQPQVIRPGNPSFPLPPGSVPYIHVLSGTSHQSPDMSGMNSGQSYLIHPHFPQTQGSTQSSHSFPTYGPQRFAWSQNVHQIPPTGPLPTPRAYLPPSSQGYPMERGLLLQPPSQHAPPPPPPPYPSSSSFSTTDPFGSSVHSLTQHSYVHSMGPLLPPPPPPPLPPPPLPPSSPPGVPPLPPSSPPSDNLSNNDGSCNSKEALLERSNLMLKCHPLRMKPAKDKSVHDVDFTCQSTEIGPEVETITHSPADSDMDMEDDITQPDEEKQRLLSKNFNDECVTLSKDVAKEQLQASQHSGGQRLPKVVLDGSFLDGSLLNAGSLVSQDQRLGAEIPSTCDPVTGRVHSESNHSETSGAKLSNQLGDANPFKHLQGYASDNSSDSEVDKLLGDVSHPSVKVGSMNFSAEKGCSFVSELESSKPVSSKSMIESSRIANEDDGKACFATGKAEEFADKSPGDQESVRDVTYTALQSKNSSRSCGINIDLEGGNFQKPDIKSDHAKLNVDEFGRLVREGASDSDTSDTPRYTQRQGRRGRKRSRSQSRSRSPRDRRRRSPSRRKERRHQSRSLSPKRQCSRSKSPISRRGSEFIGDRLRREKGQLPECFDFLRGKCYRGATCRYLHQSDKGERLRYNRGKQQYQDMPPTLRSSDFHADRISEKKSGFENKEAKDKGPKLLQDMPGVEELKNAKELPLDLTSHFPDKLNYLQSVSPLVADTVARNLSSDSSHDMATGNENSLIQESPAKISDKNPQLVHHQSKQMANSLISESSSLVQTSAAISAHFPADRPDKEEDPIGQPYSVRSPTTKSYSVEEVPSHSLNSKDFSPSISHHSLPSDSQVVSAQLGQGISQDYSLMQSTTQFHLKTENYSPCQAPVSYQYSHIPKPSKSSSSFLPPPKPPHTHVAVNVATVEHNLLSQHTQQSLLPPRNGLSSYTSMRPHPSELHTQSQIDEYQAYTSAQEPDQMPHKMDDSRSSCLHASNKMNQQGGSHVSGEGPGHPEQGMNSLQSFSQALPKSFLMQTPPKRMHASLLGSLPSNSNPSFSHPYLQQDYYGLKYSVADGVSAQLGEPGKLSGPMSRVTPDFIERNHPSCVPDFVGSRVSIHFNPYASTFDQPLISQFSSNALSQAKDTQFNTKYGPPLGLISIPVHGHNAGSVSSTNMISSSTSARAAEGVLPRPGGDQYDPLFDSIEPASNSLRSDNQKHEITDDSDDIPKFSGSGKMLNVDSIKLEEAAALSANDSLEIEEYGETADAEVGAVVNGSPVNPHNTTEMSPGEVEIDQVKASGKNRKGKDTRSMKLFKISIATFVKEVLKPSWRQGNMSKEAFKTIVKKTVDKVSSAMKSHRIPKSQAKINHYIDSSRGKLTKLVMGYVDKYVKV